MQEFLGTDDNGEVIILINAPVADISIQSALPEELVESVMANDTSNEVQTVVANDTIDEVSGMGKEFQAPDINNRPTELNQNEESKPPIDPVSENPAIDEEIHVSFKLIKGASRRGMNLLVDSKGYMYTKKLLGKKRTSKNKCIWRCSARSKSLTCAAIVYQDGSVFRMGEQAHVHQPKENAAVKAIVTATAKSLVREKKNIFTHTLSLVEHAMAITEGSEAAGLDTAAIARNVNRLILNTRPKEPDNLGFALAEDFIPKQNKESKPLIDPVSGNRGIDEETQISFKLIEGASKRGMDLLVDSYGYLYTKKALGKKKISKSKCVWRCRVRNKNQTCTAIVYQDNFAFRMGDYAHIHQPEESAAVKARVTAIAKSLAREKKNIFTPTLSLVERAISSLEGSEAAVLDTAAIARNVNHLRQIVRPDQPDNLGFALAEDFIPKEFLQKDLVMNGARHLIFATPMQLALLKTAKTWYCDATTRVQDPFIQLFRIHGFVKGPGNNVKQVPLTFVLMSRNRQRDYKKVFKAVLIILQECVVKKFVIDFEAAVWIAVRKVFPVIRLQGCSFYWSREILRKVQELGLDTSYEKHKPTKLFIQRLLSLPFLPAEHIPSALVCLEEQACGGALRVLTDFVKGTRINGFWKPSDWSVFGQSVRTSSDVEGYQQSLSGAAGSSHIAFYVLIPLLHKEAQYINAQVSLVRDKSLSRHQRKSSSTQGKIFALWKEYEEGVIDIDQLLKACSSLNFYELHALFKSS